MIAGWATKWHPNWHRTAGHGQTSSGRKYAGGQPEPSETLTIGDAGTWGGSDAHALAHHRLQPLGHSARSQDRHRPPESDNYRFADRDAGMPRRMPVATMQQLSSAIC